MKWTLPYGILGGQSKVFLFLVIEWIQYHHHHHRTLLKLLRLIEFDIFDWCDPSLELEAGHANLKPDLTALLGLGKGRLLLKSDLKIENLNWPKPGLRSVIWFNFDLTCFKFNLLTWFVDLFQIWPELTWFSRKYSLIQRCARLLTLCFSSHGCMWFWVCKFPWWN